ncbi:cytochrome C oxidase subunit [Mucor ambiguus]|uniref:Cytochrome C oxidase subunit n=1 Tax=Mucor ambiguus TaxID=91626 RepID=A0A0C9N5E1_9FUNG|nr:cytochrome C oxidase subunit [Mucor ambiguus]
MSVLRTATVIQTSHLKRLGARYQSQLAKTEFAVERQAVKVHAAESAETWKKICTYVCIPTLIAASYNAYNLFQKHQEHSKEHPKAWVKYPYINYRGRDFFWGKNSLFFNPEVNLDATEE